MVTHPKWERSKIPPTLLGGINELQGQYRREYLVERLDKYQTSLSTLEAAGMKIAKNWTTRQAEHLQKVIHELECMLDLETKGKTEFQGITYDDNTTSE